MEGLLVLGILGGWIYACRRMAHWIMRNSELAAPWRSLAIWSVGVMLFFAPVTDEVVTHPQFYALCHKGTPLKIDAQRIRGRSIREDVGPKRRVPGTLVPIYRTHVGYVDASTGEELAYFDGYSVHAGFMARLIGYPEGNEPWTFESSVCFNRLLGRDMARRYGFVLVERGS